MLTDDRARDLLRSAVADLIVSDAPADELVRRGRRTRRRTRLTAVLGGVAAVGLIAVGSAVVSDMGGLANEPATTQSTAPTETPPTPENGLVTPPGTRLVGMGPIAVAVPEDWGTNKVKCGQPLADTVVFEGSGTRACLVPQRDVSSVHFGETTQEQKGAPTIDLGEVEITRSDITEVPGAQTYPLSVGRVTVPSHDVAMLVRSTDQELIRRILDSVQAIPTGYLAIPVPYGSLKVTEARIEQTGLAVHENEVYRPNMSGGVLLSSDPPLGSVVPRGSTVTVNVSTAMPQPEKDDQVVNHLHQLAIGASATPPWPSGGPYIPVTLGLGDEAVREEHLPNLNDPDAWVIHRRSFNGYSGPFSAGAKLATDPDTWSVTEEGQQSCPWGRASDLPGFEKDRRLTIEPANITSCLEWWAVDVYVNEGGTIGAISLNLVEP